ncbi:MAG: hypothetical protein F4X57_12215 [Chloroflexi bacterium]|nr:hypothetical protein [Chloroflexota bacterium]
MTDKDISVQVFAEVRDVLTDDELLELARDLNLAAINYNEHLRDIVAGIFDTRIAKLRAKRCLRAREGQITPASDHWTTDSEESVIDPPPTSISSSESDGNAPPPSDSELVCGNATLNHIASCQDQREAAYKIATLNPEGFAVREAAALIYAAGLSKGKLKTISSNIYTLAADDDNWQRLGPGRYRLLPEIRPVDSDIFDYRRQDVADDDGEDNELVQVA